MEEISCPSCHAPGKLPIDALSKKVRCRCGTEFCPLEYIPQWDFPRDHKDFSTLVLRGAYFLAVGYEHENGTFTVVRGSLFLRNHALDPHLTSLRDELISRKDLKFVPKLNAYLSLRDITFQCSGEALAIVSGGSARTKDWGIVSGSTAWNSTPSSRIRRKKFARRLGREIAETLDCSPEETRPDFLSLDGEQLRTLIVTVLEQRPNNSVKRDDLAKEVLREIGVRTSGQPRLDFERKLLRQVHNLSDQNVIEEYRSKNRRIRLSEQYRRHSAGNKNGKGNLQPIAQTTIRTTRRSLSDDPYTVTALKAQNARLRKIIAALALDVDID